MIIKKGNYSKKQKDSVEIRYTQIHYTKKMRIISNESNEFIYQYFLLNDIEVNFIIYTNQLCINSGKVFGFCLFLFMDSFTCDI